jgi:probable DNA repair protein
MGTGSAAEIDAWLRGGGLVVTASERAARFLELAFHRARRSEGLAAWPAPNIQDWQTFVRSAWNQRSFEGRLVLNPLQEQSLWAQIVAASGQSAGLLEGPRYCLADMAMEAHGLLCTYAPQFLSQAARGAWQRDAEVFSAWLTDFDAACRERGLMSSARLPLELIEALKADSSERPPLLLAGFDRIPPTQQRLFSVWGGDGSVRPVSLDEEAARMEFHQAADPASELAACAHWCRQRLAANPRARLLVVTQDVSEHRGEMERAFLRFAAEDGNARGGAALFEFSLGVPLSQIGLARGANLLLHWLDGSIAENELDWLLASGQTAVSPEESAALTGFMRALRRRGRQRTRWGVEDFAGQTPGETALPAAWAARMMQAQRQLRETARHAQPPMVWSELAPRLLEIAGWPGVRPLASAEFQALRRWRQTVEGCASLGFDGRRGTWKEFLASLDRAVDATLFAPESQDAPILIAGAAESAGLSADAVWFLSADEDAWPAGGSTHPFLPLAVQREAGMPHATAQLDWDLAAAITRRLLASAPEVHFSYARQSEGVDARPSRLIVQLAGPPQPLTAAMPPAAISAPLTVDFEDCSRIPFPAGRVEGGSSVLTLQSQCPFKAFATARLGAQGWEPAEAGLTAKERGLLLHAVLHSVWGGPPHGMRTHTELEQQIESQNLSAFVAGHVRSTLQREMPSRARASMPQRYIALEERRLTDLVTEWLRYEAARAPFTVLETEHESDAAISGLDLHLRLDRIDRLIDNSLLVIDYKSGDVKPSAWDLPRPDDVQLPLYAGFALPQDATLGGLVFAKVHAGKMEFAGRVRDAKTGLLPNVTSNHGLVKKKLTDADLEAWRNAIEQLARDFLAGRAGVDPREYPKTCERCGLQALCRIQEDPPQDADEAGDDGEEAADA